MTVKSTVKSALQDVDGQTSSNRMFLFLTMMFILITSTYIAFSTGAIPDVSDSWIYIIGIFSGAALGGKATNAVKTYKSKPVDDSEDMH